MSLGKGQQGKGNNVWDRLYFCAPFNQGPNIRMSREVTDICKEEPENRIDTFSSGTEWDIFNGLVLEKRDL